MENAINPDSTILQQVDGEWQKLAAAILWKLVKRGVVKVTVEDLKEMEAEFAPGMACIFTHGHAESIEFSLVTMEQAERLAAHDKTMRGAA